MDAFNWLRATFSTDLGWMLVLAVTTVGPMCAQNTASGTLTIGKDKFELKFAAATLVPDSFDKTKLKTRIVLADKPFGEDILDDESQVWDLKASGHHGIEVEISQDKSNYSLFVISSTLSGSLSRSGTFDGKQLTVFTNERVEGALQAAPEETAGTLMGYSVRFAVNVTPREAAPTPADAAAAASKESVKSYLSLVDAIRTGNKQKIIEMAPPDRRASIDTPDFPQMLKLVQAMTPEKIEVLKAVETGDHARLLARGLLDGAPQRGKIYLNRVNGKWVMANETWGAE